MKNCFGLFSILGIFFFGLQAQAFELSVVGAGNSSSPSVTFNGSTSTATSKLAFGGGVLLGFSMLPTIELEIGALYVGRHFTTTTSSVSEEDSYFSYEVPVILRLTGLKYLTLGGGLYYAVPTGQDNYTTTLTGGTPTTGSNTATSSFKNDLGAVASVGIKFPIGIASNFLVDGRYYYGLTNASQTSSTTAKFRDIQVLAGINFDF